MQFQKSIIITLIVTLMYCSLLTKKLEGAEIKFRDISTYNQYSYHHGDLWLLSNKTNYTDDYESWGWLKCNRIQSFGVSYNNEIYGNFSVYGTKNFVHPHPVDTTKEIIYTCVEAGEALTLVRGVASTVNGKAIIDLPEHFRLVTSSQGLLTVIVTAEEKPALLYVVSKSKARIVVAMKESDFYEYQDVSFSFQVTGVRDGFEETKPIQSIFEEEPVSEKRKIYNKKIKSIMEKKEKIMLKKKGKDKSETNKEDE